MWAKWSLHKRLIVSIVGLFSVASLFLLVLISMSQYQLYKDQLRSNYQAQLSVLADYLSVYVEFDDQRSLRRSSKEWVQTSGALGLSVIQDKQVLFTTGVNDQCETDFSLLKNRMSVEFDLFTKGRLIGSVCATWALDNLRSLLLQNGSILLIVFVVFIIGVSLGVRRLMKSLFIEIDVLRSSVKKISRIEHEYREARLTELKEPDLQEIAQAFNEMLEELQKKENLLMRNQRLTVVGQLSSGVAHEIANPLMGISTLIQELKYDLRENPESSELLELIDSQILRIKKILERLQLLVKGEVDVQLQYEQINLSDFVQRCFISIELERNSVAQTFQLIFDVPDDLCVEADQYKLQQVISNLVNNAIDAAQESVIVQLIAREDDDRIKFTVLDNGCGIPKKMLDRAFEPFYTDKGKTGIMGTGLGLSIVKEIIQSHRGEIFIDSEVDKGTRVVFYLPLRAHNKEGMNAL